MNAVTTNGLLFVVEATLVVSPSATIRSVITALTVARSVIARSEIATIGGYPFMLKPAPVAEVRVALGASCIGTCWPVYTPGRYMSRGYVSGKHMLSRP